MCGIRVWMLRIANWLDIEPIIHLASKKNKINEPISCRRSRSFTSIFSFSLHFLLSFSDLSFDSQFQLRSQRWYFEIFRIHRHIYTRLHKYFLFRDRWCDDGIGNYHSRSINYRFTYFSMVSERQTEEEIYEQKKNSFNLSYPISAQEPTRANMLKYPRNSQEPKINFSLVLTVWFG